MATLNANSQVTANTDYLQTKNCNVCTSRNVKYIVMHYTGNSKDTALSNVKYFYNNTLKSSAHLFVDEDSVYQSVALKDKAWHCGTSGTYYHSECRNANSIGIEMCTSGSYRVSDTTINNAVNVCAECCRLIGIGADDVDTYVIRHYDVTHKDCPSQWVSDSSGFASFKDKVKAALSGSTTVEITEYTDTEEILWELMNRNIVTDVDLWRDKMNADTNIYWLCRKIVQYVRTKTYTEYADYAYADTEQILWELMNRGIVTDVDLWRDKMCADSNVYWLCQKAVHYIRTQAKEI